jgi:hypothetical protein
MRNDRSRQPAPGTADVPLSTAHARTKRHRRHTRHTRRIQDAWLRSLSAIHPPGLRTPPPTRPQDP